MTEPEFPEVMTPGEVAAVFGVGATRVAVWRDKGLIKSFRTPGGRHRYYGWSVREAWKKVNGHG